MNKENGISDRFKELRKHLGKSQIEFAEVLGLKQASLSDIERGRVDLNTKIITTLIELYQVSSDWLITGKGDMIIAINDNEMHGIDARNHARNNEKNSSKSDGLTIESKQKSNNQKLRNNDEDFKNAKARMVFNEHIIHRRESFIKFISIERFLFRCHVIEFSSRHFYPNSDDFMVNLIEKWLNEGLSNEEIYDKMDEVIMDLFSPFKSLDELGKILTYMDGIDSFFEEGFAIKYKEYIKQP